MLIFCYIYVYYYFLVAYYYLLLTFHLRSSEITHCHCLYFRRRSIIYTEYTLRAFPIFTRAPWKTRDMPQGHYNRVQAMGGIIRDIIHIILFIYVTWTIEPPERSYIIRALYLYHTTKENSLAIIHAYHIFNIN